MSVRIAAVALVLSCGPSPSEWTGTIGAEGGVVEARGVVLTVPADALPEPTEVRIRRLDDAPAGWRALSGVYEFEPAGLMFDEPVRVRFDTTNSDPAEVVAWITDSTERLSAERAGTIVTTSIEHFSVGFVGVEEDAGDGGTDVGRTDAGADAPGDSSTDVADDAHDADADASAGLDCWVEEIMDPAPPGFVARFESVAASDLVAVGGELKQIRRSQLYSWDGTWTRTDLAADLTLGIAADEFRGAALTVDSAGDLHAVLHAERTAKPNPFYLRHDGTDWSVEDMYPMAPTVGDGVCFSRENTKSNIAVAADGVVHAVFDCAPSGEGRLYRPVYHCRREATWSCGWQISPSEFRIGAWGPTYPELALIAGEPHVLFHNLLSTDFRIHHFGTVDPDARFTAGPAVEDYMPDCTPGEPEIWAADRGTLLDVDGAPVAYYTFADICRWPTVLELRRAELVGDAFVVRPIASSVTIVSNALRHSDGTEVIVVRGHGFESSAPPFFPPTDVRLLRVTADGVDATEITWTALPDESVGSRSHPDRIAVVTLAEADDGVVHGTYLGTDGVLRHVRTCPSM